MLRADVPSRATRAKTRAAATFERLARDRAERDAPAGRRTVDAQPAPTGRCRPCRSRPRPRHIVCAARYRRSGGPPPLVASADVHGRTAAGSARRRPAGSAAIAAAATIASTTSRVRRGRDSAPQGLGRTAARARAGVARVRTMPARPRRRPPRTRPAPPCASRASSASSSCSAAPPRTAAWSSQCRDGGFGGGFGDGLKARGAGGTSRARGVTKSETVSSPIRLSRSSWNA